MKWNNVLIILLIPVCLWLAFDKFSNQDKIDDLELKVDSLNASDKYHQIRMRSYKLKAEKQHGIFAKTLNQLNRDHEKQIKALRKFNIAVDTRHDNMDSSSAFSLLSNWLVRETGEGIK